MKIVNKQNNFFFLLAALLMILLILPIISDIYGTRNWLVGHLVFSVTLFFSVLSLKDAKKWLKFGIFLVLCGVVFSTLAFYKDSRLYLCLSLFFDFLFLLLVISIALQQVVFSDRINLHNVAGAACVYLLLGIIWSLAYYFINIILPGSFKGNLSFDTQMQLNDFVYYSFVTLTTLGYGDIVPVSATARSLVYMEAVFGQFYIAILVAGLVSIHISNQSRESIKK
jgi:hypothetical protein